VTALDLAFVLYIVVYCLLEAVNASELRYEARLTAAIEPTFWFLAYASARSVVGSIDEGVAAIRAFSMPVFLVAPIAIGQALHFEPITNLTSAIVTSDGFTNRLESGSLLRAVGLVGGWTSFGTYSTGLATAAVALLIAGRRYGVGRLGYPYVVLALAIAQLLTTLTFSTMIALLVVLFGAARYLNLRAGFLFGLVVSAIVLIALFGGSLEERFGEQYDGRVRLIGWLPDWMPNTIAYRVYIWTSQTIPMILQRPWSGWGNGVYDALDPGGVGSLSRRVPSGNDWLSPESQWFGVLMNGGVIGLTSLLFLLVAAGALLWKARSVAEATWLAVPLFWFFIANLAICLTALNFTNKGLPGVFWPMVGIVSGIALAGRTESQRLANPIKS
jgi:O-antigen ligase